MSGFDFEQANERIGAGLATIVPGMMTRWIVIAVSAGGDGDSSAYIGGSPLMTSWDGVVLLGYAAHHSPLVRDDPEAVQRIGDLISEVLAAQTAEPVFLTKWVLLAEIIGADDPTPTFTVLTSPELPVWDLVGLPLYALQDAQADAVREEPEQEP